MKNYYHILGCQNFATLEQIKCAYRRLALRYHPDRGGDLEKMKEINIAYEFLIKNKEVCDNTLRPKKPVIRTYGFTIIVNGYGFSTSNSTTGAMVW